MEEQGFFSLDQELVEGKTIRRDARQAGGKTENSVGDFIGLGHLGLLYLSFNTPDV